MFLMNRFFALSGIMAAATILLAPAPALSQQEPAPQPGPAPAPAPASSSAGGLYFLVGFGLGDTKDPQTDADFQADLSWNSSLDLGMGYRFGPVRLEGAFFHHYFRVQDLEVGPAAPFAEDTYAGAVTADGLMASVYFDLATSRRAKPYLGAGYGFADVEATYNNSVCIFYCFSTEDAVVDDHDTVAAWQAMAGFSFPAWNPGIEWFIGYRYFGTDDVTMRTVDGTVFTQDGVSAHSVNGGFRFFF